MLLVNQIISIGMDIVSFFFDYFNVFCYIFSISPNMAPNRIQTSFTLLLTSITFRWTINRSLPTIAYLTTMDKYAISSIFILVTLAIWHATIGVLIFYYTSNTRITPTLWLVKIDRYVFFGAISVYIIIQVTFLLWIFCVPLKYRRQLREKDIQYRRLLTKKM